MPSAPVGKIKHSNDTSGKEKRNKEKKNNDKSGKGGGGKHINDSSVKGNNHHPPASPPRIILPPPGIHEGYDPYNDPLLQPPPPTPMVSPAALPPPPQHPMNSLERKESDESEKVKAQPKEIPLILPLSAETPEISKASKVMTHPIKAPRHKKHGKNLLPVPALSREPHPGSASSKVSNGHNRRSKKKQGKSVSPVPQAKILSPDDDDKVAPIALEEGLESKEFFHGFLPREDIEAMLRRNGHFVLRVTELNEAVKKETPELCLSVYWNGNTHHFVLNPNASKRYSICQPTRGEKLPYFENVLTMVQHYMNSQTSFSTHKVVLRKPIGRQDWELRHDEITCNERLGSGAFGDVYSGELRRKNKKLAKVAIKMLKGENVDKKKILEIMSEARILRPLSHKHVVRCYGVASDMEPVMILMELINGGALDIFLKCNTSKVSLNQRINMCFDAALGLEFVHSKNVLHRDVAARNCLYDSKVLKISDFGLSVIGDRHNLNAREKTPLRWLSPEVFRTQVFTRAADVWAFGVLLWEIFNDAQEPYKGWTGTQIGESILQYGNKLQMPDWAGPNMNKLVTEIFEIEPNNRISMSDVVKRIEKFAPKNRISIVNESG